MNKVCRRLAAAVALASVLLAAGPALARPQVVYSGESTCRDIALTYDVEFGPATRPLLKLVNDLGIRTTWFFLGSAVSANAEFVREVAQRHQIGNHTFTHPVMTRLDQAQMKSQLERAEQAIAAAAGESPEPLWRPPYGSWNRTVAEVAEAEGYPYTVLWSVDTRDWGGPPAEVIARHIVSKAFPGAIVLQHGFPVNTVEGTQTAVQELKARGYQFLTVTEILGIDRQQRDFGGDTYVVQPGDELEQVARCHNVTPARLMTYNEVPVLWAGWTLRIPYRDELIIRVDGGRQSLAAYPRLLEGRALAPVALAEALGAAVSREGGTAVVSTDTRRLVFTPGQTAALVDGQPVEMGAPAVAAGEHLLVPVRFLAEQLGRTVGFEADTLTVQISRPPAPPGPAPQPPPPPLIPGPGPGPAPEPPPPEPPQTPPPPASSPSQP